MTRLPHQGCRCGKVLGAEESVGNADGGHRPSGRLPSELASVEFIQQTEAPDAVKRAKDKDQPCTLIVVPLDRNDWDKNSSLEQELKTLQTATWNAKAIQDFTPQSKGWLQVEQAIRKAVEARRE